MAEDDFPAIDAAVERLSPFVTKEDLPRVQMIVGETISEITMHHSGPLPRARDLAEYQAVDPSFAERIVRMAEKEQERRHSLPDGVLDREYRLKSRGQHYALIVVVLVLAFAGGLAWLGDTDMAGKVAIATLIGLVSVFVGGRAIDAFGDREKNEDS